MAIPAEAGGIAAGGHRENHQHTEGARKAESEAQPSSVDQRRADRILYGCTAVLVLTMQAIAFTVNGIYPFGDQVLIYADGDQYFSILGYLQNTLYSSDNLLYSWSTVLGGNMMGIIAYYGASPFNLLTVLFPDNLVLAYHVILAVKFTAASITFAVMLRKMFPGASVGPLVLFAASYPFIGFMSYFAWNQSWMDGVIYLPLICLGVWQILHGGRLTLYIVALALAVFSCYYTGYMICIASLLLFLAGCVLRLRRIDRTFWRIVLRYVAASAAGVALTAVLLLPAYASLPPGRTETLAELVQNAGYLSEPEETLAMLYTAPYNNMSDADNGPVIYVGIVQLVLDVLFFLNRDISRRCKAASGTLLVVFALSFTVSLLNKAWHGFTQNVWFNYRYSFLLSFILELIACCSFIRITGVRGRFLAAGAVTAAITAAALGAARHNIGPGTLVTDAVLICLALWLLQILAGTAAGRRRTAAFVVLAALTLGNLVHNACLSLDRSQDISRYTEAVSMNAAISEAAPETGLQRRASTWKYGRCDPMLFGYAGIDNFASSDNQYAVSACYDLGIRGWTWESMYGENVPISTDALLGITHVVTDNPAKKTYYEQVATFPDKGLSVVENRAALPVIFPADRSYTSGGDAADKLGRLNEYWNSVSPVGGNVLTQIRYERQDTPADDGTDIRIRFTTTQNGPVYARIPVGDRSVSQPLKDDGGMGTTFDGHQDVYYAGNHAPGQTVEFVIHAGGSYDRADEIVVYSENPEAVAAKGNAVQKISPEIEKISSSHLTFKYDFPKTTVFATTIPYSEGWHVTVDGQDVETYWNMDYFLAFDAPAGEHTVELVYWPPLFWTGAAISIAAAIVLAVYIIRTHPKSRRGGPNAEEKTTVPAAQAG